MRRGIAAGLLCVCAACGGSSAGTYTLTAVNPALDLEAVLDETASPGDLSVGLAIRTRVRHEDCTLTSPVTARLNGVLMNQVSAGGPGGGDVTACFSPRFELDISTADILDPGPQLDRLVIEDASGQIEMDLESFLVSRSPTVARSPADPRRIELAWPISTDRIDLAHDVSGAATWTDDAGAPNRFALDATTLDVTPFSLGFYLPVFFVGVVNIELAASGVTIPVGACSGASKCEAFWNRLDVATVLPSKGF